MKKRIVAVLAVLLMTITAPFLIATSVRTVNLEEMVNLSERVFRGRCLSVEAINHRSGMAVSEYTFEVLEAIKGVRPGEEIVFRQVDATGRGRLPGIIGMPAYPKGREILLFLHGDSQIGLTSPVGLGQGVFAVDRTVEGQLKAVNAVKNRNLARNLSFSRAQEIGFGRQRLNEIRKGGPVSLSLLTSMVRQIDKFQKERQEKGKSVQ